MTPWTVAPSGYSEDPGASRFVKHGNETIAEVYPRHDVKIRDAHAAAIAAIPEMIHAFTELLKVATVRIDDPRCAKFDAARDALAKATGGKA